MAEIHTQRKGKDPFLKANFLIEIDGVNLVSAYEVAGIKATYAVATYRDGNDPNYFKKQRGLKTFEDIEIKRGLTSDSGALYDWFESGERKTVGIIQLDHLGDPVKKWLLYEAFPKEFAANDGFSASSESDIQIESLVITYENMEEVGV